MSHLKITTFSSFSLHISQANNGFSITCNTLQSRKMTRPCYRHKLLSEIVQQPHDTPTRFPSLPPLAQTHYVLCQTAICSHGPWTSRWHTLYIPQHLHTVVCVSPSTLHAAPRDFHFITLLKDIKGNCFRLTWPLQILGQTLTVPTDMPTSNHGKETDCPNWYAHFKSWQG